MKNREIASILEKIAEGLELEDSAKNRFKIRAYKKAYETISSLSEDLAEIRKKQDLTEISGIGKSIASIIDEYIDTGKIGVYEGLKKKFGEGLLELLEIPFLGPKTLKLFYEELGVKDIESLKEVLDGEEVLELPRMGEKQIQKIKDGIVMLENSSGRVLLGRAYPIVNQLLELLRSQGFVEKAEAAGSFLRREATVGDIDILAYGDAEKIMEYFVSMALVKKVLAKGETKSSVIIEGDLQVDLRVVLKENWGGALQYFTGSRDHNVEMRKIAISKGLKLSEYGVLKDDNPIVADDEVEVYKALGVNWIPPELRLSAGEIEMAKDYDFSDLVKLSDIKGDLHMHSDYSDGQNSIEEMTKACIERGYQYIAITDHSKSLVVAKGLDEKRLKEKKAEIEEIQPKYSEIKILFGTEVDILSDGSLDYRDEILKDFDWVVGSIHVGFTGDQTERLLKAMDNKYLNMIGHPTTRRILKRGGVSVDWDKIFQKAGDKGIIMEINAQSERLDLPWDLVRKAKKYGVKFIVNTDSHSKESLWYMELGVAHARKGLLKPSDVVNTLDWEEFKKLMD